MTNAPPQLPEGCAHVHIEAVDGTNAEAMRRVLAGARAPLWITADRQTAGKGRSGRTWTSRPGNLFVSYVAAVNCPPAKAGQLSLVAGVAVHDAITRAGGAAGLRLKWPNDILIGPAKAGGILIESTVRPGEAGAVAVIGIGLNLVSAPENLGRAATFLAQHGLELSPQGALCFLAHTMKDWMTKWDDGAGFVEVREAWLERAGAIGEPLTVHAGATPVSGRFAGLDDRGALLLDSGDGRQLSFSFGDVSLDAQGDGA